MKTILIVAAALALAGCTSLPGGGFALESTHGYCGSMNIKNTKMVACPTIDGAGAPMGYRKNLDGSVENMYSTFTDGTRSGTGNAADILAEAERFEKLMLLCAVAPNSALCGGSLPID